MRVALDATALLGTRTGIGRFTAEVVHRLPREGVAVIAYAASLRGASSLPDLLPASVDVVRRPMTARPLREMWRRTGHPIIERWTGPIDVVYGPNFVVPPSRAAEVVTIHDLTCVHHPEMCTRDTLQLPALIERAVARGAWIHTVSRFVADEVIAQFDVPASRVRAIPNGSPDPVPEPLRLDRASRGRGLIGSDRYLLALGTLEPRKDIPGLIAAFDLVAADDPQVHLVVAGPDGWGADAVSNAIVDSAFRSRIHRLGWVSTADRDALLAGAAAFIYPSVYEGFGLPPLEAMSAGTPVIATEVGALPEVLADAALWVAPGSAQALAGAITTLLADSARAERLRRAGDARVAHHDWHTTVDALCSLLHEAAESR